MNDEEIQAVIVPMIDYRDQWICKFLAMAKQKDYDGVTFVDEVVSRACIELGLVTVH